MIKHNRFGRTLTVKVKYGDFQQVTRSLTQDHPFQSLEVILSQAYQLLKKTEAVKRPIRLLGVGISKLDSGKAHLTASQLSDIQLQLIE